MRRRIAIVLAAACLLRGGTARAHRIDEYLQATVLSLETHRVQASMRLIPGIFVAPSVIAGIDSNGDGVFSKDEEQVYAQRVLEDLSCLSDGKRVEPKLVSWSVPQPQQLRDGLGEIHIEYTMELPAGGVDRSLSIENRHQRNNSVYLVNVLVPEDRGLNIVTQERNKQQSVYVVEYREDEPGAVRPSAAGGQLAMAWRGSQFSSLFHLGLRHIAEGTDHLLFLLTLLLPAPLLVSGKRWGSAVGVRPSVLRILGIVSAFTVGHSMTLSLAAMGAVHVPSRPVEVLIAVSILVSALHAWRPLVPGNEALLAGGFGLIHGLAFAATLDRLGEGRWDQVAGIAAFNLGIEAMQVVVVLAVLPSLLLMSSMRAYPVVRRCGAAFAGAAAVGWIVDRSFGVATPVDGIVNAIAHYGPWLAMGFLAVSVLCRFLLPLTTARQPSLTAGPGSTPPLITASGARRLRPGASAP